MGFYHEHVRADRDDYVIVNMTNIKPDAQINYEKLPFEAWLDVESPYDLKFGIIITIYLSNNLALSWIFLRKHLRLENRKFRVCYHLVTGFVVVGLINEL